MASEKVHAFTDDNFEAEVINAEKPVLVDFWAAWCGPCKMIAPVIDEIAEELDGKLKVGKVDVDANQKTAGNFGVMSIPTLIILKNGAEVERIVGYKTKNELANIINANI